MVRQQDARIVRSVKPIVRSCGERTTRQAVALLSKIFDIDDIEVVREVPFEKALRATYEIGIASGREWAFVMDADVLPSPRRLRQALTSRADRVEDVFVFRGLVLDKFFGWPREVGNYIYRTSLLGTALDLIPRAGAKVRPEFSTIQAMHHRGHRMETVEDMTYAVHDFEQFYKDLFRKGYVYASKHPAMQILMTDWQKRGEKDADFFVMLAGAVAHNARGGEVEIDVRRFPKDLGVFLTNYGLAEKDVLSDLDISEERVDSLISSWSPSPVYHAYHAYLGLWPRDRSGFSPARMRALFGWMRKSRKRGSLSVELRYLITASLRRQRRSLKPEFDFDTLFADPSD